MTDLISREAAKHEVASDLRLPSWHSADLCRKFDALPAQAPAVKVRPLVWMQHPTARHHSALCEFGLYLADVTGWRWAYSPWVDAVGMEAAKDAAQADYAARILAAIEPAQGGEA